MDWTPALVVWAALSAPFLARLFVAGNRWRRVRGLAFTPNVEPRIEMDDFPPPNQPTRDLAVGVGATLLAAPVALFVEALLGSVVPRPVWQLGIVCVGVAAGLWTLQRLRRDERLWLKVKLERITRRGRVTLPHAE